MARSELVAFKLEPDKKELVDFAVSIMKFPDRSALIREALEQFLDWKKLKEARVAAEKVFGTKFENPDEIESQLKGKVLGVR